MGGMNGTSTAYTAGFTTIGLAITHCTGTVIASGIPVGLPNASVSSLEMCPL